MKFSCNNVPIIPFSRLSHLRKHKAHIWDPPGRAAFGCHFFPLEKTKEIWQTIIFLPFIVTLNKFKPLGWITLVNTFQ